jgi:L-iditol 2-dehydrogenase
VRAAVLVAPSTFEVRPVEPPAELQGAARVDVAFCGVCGSDLAIYDRDPPIPRFWPGHEIAGFERGRLVAVNPLVFCGACESCKSGRENLCREARMISHHLPGGFAEAVHVPAGNLRPIETTPERAACLEPLASSLHALGVAGALGGRRVAVVGAGIIGLLLVQLARARGAARVGLRARHAHQRELGLRFGAGDVDFAPDVVLVASAGDGSGLQWAADEARAGGRIVLLGNIYRSRALNLKWLVERELEVAGSQRYTRRDFEQAALAIEAGAVELDPLITHRFPLSEISRAYAVAQDKATHRSVKVLVHPDP